jgi:ESF2/ABP1 family protein
LVESWIQRDSDEHHPFLAKVFYRVVVVLVSITTMVPPPSGASGSDDDDQEEEEEVLSENEASAAAAIAGGAYVPRKEEEEEDPDEEVDEEEDDDDDDSSSTKAEDQEEQINNKPRKVFRLSLVETADDFNAQLAKRGVLYLPSVPPSMTPTILRQLLEPHGEITRLYLKPNFNHRSNNNNNSNNKKTRVRYAEGWVEFSKRSTAKRIVLCLHQTTITNHQRSIMCGDLWNMKYLGKRFKWEILTETIAYERRVREQRLRLETMQARKEAHQYQAWLSHSDTLDQIAKRRRQAQNKKDQNDESSDHHSKTATTTDHDGTRKRTRQYRRGEKQPFNEQGVERATKKIILESLL